MPRSLRATRAGWCFVAIVFGVGFAAQNTGNNLLYLVLALMLAFLVLSGLLSETSLRGLRVERHLPGEIFARTPNRVILRVHNDQKRVPAFAISIDDRIATAEGPDSAGRAFVLRIGPGDSADRSYILEPDRRGDLAFIGCRLSTRFPFGLFVKSVDLAVESSALVYPQLFETHSAADSVRKVHDSDDSHTNRRDGDEVAGVREFVEGDSIHRIHWRRSLRQSKLIVAEREGTGAAEIEVLLRLPADLEAGEVEDRVARAATQVVGHLGAGLHVGLRTDQAHFAPGTGIAHRRALLVHLTRVMPDDGQPKQASARLSS
jgi:uncharacterized protein (DUF58 family)